MPPRAYVEAMDALLTWLTNNLEVLESEKFAVTETAVLESQLKQFNVCLHFIHGFGSSIVTRIFIGLTEATLMSLFI